MAANKLTRTYYIFLFFSVCIGCVGLFSPILMSAKNIFLSIVCIGLVLSLNWKAVFKDHRNNWFLIASLFLFLVIAIGVLYSAGGMDRGLSILGKYRKLLYPLVLLPFFNYYTKGRSYFIHGLFFGVIGVFLLGALKYFGYLPAACLAPAFPFINPIYGSFIVAIGAYLAIIYAVNPNCTRSWRIFYSLVCLLGSLTIFFLQAERTGYYVYIILMAFVLFTIPVVFDRHPKDFFIFGIMCMVSMLFVSFPKVKSRTDILVQEFNEYKTHRVYKYTSIGERLHLMDKGWSFIKEKPIVGWGTGSFGALWANNHLPYLNKQADLSKNVANPHNQFLMFGVDLGFVGIFAFVFWLFSICREAIVLKSSYYYPKMWVAFACICGFIIGCFSDSMLFLNATGDFFVVFACWLLSLSKTDDL